MKLQPLRVLWTIWLTTVMVCVAVSQEPGGSKIRLSQDTWGFGAIQRGRQTSHVLVISNVGQKTLHIAQVRSSCTTCSVVEGYRQFLEPGESTEIKVTFKAEGRKGRVTKTVYIDSDDPGQPQVVFRLTGIVEKSDVPELLVDPNPWYPDTFSTDPTTDGLFVITNEGLSDLIVKAMEPQGCVVREKRVPQLAPGDSTQIHIGFDPQSLACKGERYVLIRSNDPFESELKVDVIGTASPGFSDTTHAEALLFVTEDCAECAYVMGHIVTPLQGKYAGFQVKTMSLDDSGAHVYEELRTLEKEFDNTGNEIPVLFIDRYVLG